MILSKRYMLLSFRKAFRKALRKKYNALKHNFEFYNKLFCYMPSKYFDGICVSLKVKLDKRK